MRAWLADVTARGGWTGGVAHGSGRRCSSQARSTPHGGREKGALWDLGPHVISVLWASLGPVAAVTADAGPVDVSYLILHHEGGATSTVTVSQSAGEDAAGFEAYVWGAPAGRPRRRGRRSARRRCGPRWPNSRTTPGRAGPSTHVTSGSAGTWAASSPRRSARSTSGARMWVKLGRRGRIPSWAREPAAMASGLLRQRSADAAVDRQRSRTDWHRQAPASLTTPTVNSMNVTLYLKDSLERHVHWFHGKAHIGRNLGDLDIVGRESTCGAFRETSAVTVASLVLQ